MVCFVFFPRISDLQGFSSLMKFSKDLRLITAVSVTIVGDKRFCNQNLVDESVDMIGRIVSLNC